jgi:hypothetical protein
MRNTTGQPLTGEEKSDRARVANQVRWGDRTRAAHRSSAEKLVYDRQRQAEIRIIEQDVWDGPGPSDEELDRRARRDAFERGTMLLEQLCHLIVRCQRIYRAFMPRGIRG